MAVKSAAGSFFRFGSLASLAEQAAQRTPPGLRVVALQVRQVQAIDQRVGHDWTDERAGELEGRPEGQAHDGCPADPGPATRASELRVHDAKGRGLQPQTEPGLQNTTEPKLLAERAERSQGQDAGNAEITCDWAQLAVQIPGPSVAGHENARTERDQRAEREADDQAVHVRERSRQHQPRFAAAERRGAAPK